MREQSRRVIGWSAPQSCSLKSNSFNLVPSYLRCRYTLVQDMRRQEAECGKKKPPFIDFFANRRERTFVFLAGIWYNVRRIIYQGPIEDGTPGIRRGDLREFTSRKSNQSEGAPAKPPVLWGRHNIRRIVYQSPRQQDDENPAKGFPTIDLPEIDNYI